MSAEHSPVLCSDSCPQQAHGPVLLHGWGRHQCLPGAFSSSLPLSAAFCRHVSSNLSLQQRATGKLRSFLFHPVVALCLSECLQRQQASAARTRLVTFSVPLDDSPESGVQCNPSSLLPEPLQVGSVRTWSASSRNYTGYLVLLITSNEFLSL